MDISGLIRPKKVTSPYLTVGTVVRQPQMSAELRAAAYIRRSDGILLP